MTLFGLSSYRKTKASCFPDLTSPLWKKDIDNFRDKIMHKWVFDFRIDHHHMSHGWRFLTFGIFRIHTWPQEGERMTWKVHYSGFWTTILFCFPFRVDQWR